MPNTTVRISSATRDLLREIARAEGRSMQAVLERALEHYRRRQFLDRVNEDWSMVREEPSEWHTLSADREALDGTLEDGLPADEVWNEDGEARPAEQPRRVLRKRR